MDIIYSRKRIKIPKREKAHLGKNAKKFFSIFVILVTTFFTFYSLFKSLNPVFESLALEKAREIGTRIMNEASNKILQNYDYGNIVTIENNDNSKVLKTDVVVINKIASEIALEVEDKFQNLKKDTISIPVGSLTGNRYLIGTGPNIDIKIIPAGNIRTQIKNEFESKGINQTIYRIYLELTCNVSIVTGYKTINDEITNQVLLVETVVVGDVPGAYYNLNGVSKNDALEIIH